jgi:uncharacterized membrane protein YoaT (DUF817 family)
LLPSKLETIPESIIIIFHVVAAIMELFICIWTRSNQVQDGNYG